MSFYSLLSGQFILSKKFNSKSVIDWQKNVHKDWVLESHPSLHISTIEDVENIFSGWLLGTKITSSSELNPKKLTIEQDSKIEDFLYRISGRWIAIVFCKGFSRLYLDASGSLSAVYSEIEPMVASTPSLITTKHHEENTELVKLLNLPKENNWYPSGLTSKQNVSRLLPNHYLDLINWTAHRHHYQSPMTNDISIEKNLSIMCHRLKHTVETLANHTQLSIPLTAGQDSRVILASTRNILSKSKFFTIATHDKSSKKIDCTISKLLAKKFKFVHQKIDSTFSDKNSIKEWNDITGGCAGGDIANIYTTFSQLPKNSALLTGTLGEAGRAYYWEPGDETRSSIGAVELLSRANLPLHPTLIIATEKWLKGLEQHSISTILDIFFIEQEGGCWSAPQQYGCDRFFSYHLSPFNDRSIFNAMLTLPGSYKLNGNLTSDLLKSLWQDLGVIPINSPTITMKVAKKLRSIYIKSHRLIEFNRISNTNPSNATLTNSTDHKS